LLSVGLSTSVFDEPSKARKPALGGLLVSFVNIQRHHETGTWWYTGT
jgi:hypothetical protein